MPHDIPESDWKKLRTLKDVALGRLCHRALDEVRAIIASPGPTHHERFLQVWKAVHDRNEQIASAFDALRRSTALLQLAIQRRHGLITDEEFAQFTPATRETVDRYLSIGGR